MNQFHDQARNKFKKVRDKYDDEIDAVKDKAGGFMRKHGVKIFIGIIAAVAVWIIASIVGN